MRHKVLSFWLSWALTAMLRAMTYSAELLAMHALDDVALAHKILYKAVKGKPAPAIRGVSSRVDAAVAAWEFGKQ